MSIIRTSSKELDCYKQLGFYCYELAETSDYETSVRAMYDWQNLDVRYPGTYHLAIDGDIRKRQCRHVLVPVESWESFASIAVERDRPRQEQASLVSAA